MALMVIYKCKIYNYLANKIILKYNNNNKLKQGVFCVNTCNSNLSNGDNQKDL